MEEFEKSMSQFYQNIIKTAANTVTCMDLHKNASQKVLNELRDNLEKYCKNNDKYIKMNEMSREILSMKEKKDELLNKYNEDINSYDPDVTSNDYMIEYDDRVAELMKNAVGKSNDDTSNDGELQITPGNNVNLICPISKSKMKEPMKNTICGHVYDKSSVISLLKMTKSTRCPIVGCNNKQYISMDNLQYDIVTQMRMDNIE